jgi:hypothetical protein
MMIVMMGMVTVMVIQIQIMMPTAHSESTRLKLCITFELVKKLVRLVKKLGRWLSERTILPSHGRTALRPSVVSLRHRTVDRMARDCSHLLMCTYSYTVKLLWICDANIVQALCKCV